MRGPVLRGSGLNINNTLRREHYSLQQTLSGSGGVRQEGDTDGKNEKTPSVNMYPPPPHFFFSIVFKSNLKFSTTRSVSG